MLDSPEWILEWTQSADSQLRKLDNPVVQRVLKKLEWLSQSQQPIGFLKPLKNNRSGQLSLRVQDYRVIIELFETERTILIIEVGHRKYIYDA
ncbi:MAG: type II toxin-antitoxin system RelE/ParE family toxin [Micrococcales bacterium]|nr:type II toxin-antitoxin system RelE/ParE family toxin [Micrococcales bacterium]